MYRTGDNLKHLELVFSKFFPHAKPVLIGDSNQDFLDDIGNQNLLERIFLLCSMKSCQNLSMIIECIALFDLVDVYDDIY